jgi:hypothetical protein
MVANDKFRIQELGMWIIIGPCWEIFSLLLRSKFHLLKFDSRGGGLLGLYLGDLICGLRGGISEILNLGFP